MNKVKLKLRKLNSREIATMLAALRLFQMKGDPISYHEHFADCEPLSDLEIDRLCESINFGDIALGTAI